jgi:hypothetical protein
MMTGQSLQLERFFLSWKSSVYEEAISNEIIFLIPQYIYMYQTVP